MKQINSIIQEFGQLKIESRFNTLNKEMNIFIRRIGLSKCVLVNEDLLMKAVYDYFFTIYRFKKYHGVNNINEQKVISYTSYYLLCRRPIQGSEVQYNCKELETINERFVILYILNYLSGCLGDTHILLQENRDMKKFSEELFHLFLMGVPKAQSLESIIEMFLLSYK